MKTRLLFFVSALIIVIGFSSCMGGIRLEKRHYRSGIYVHAWEKSDHSTIDSSAIDENKREMQNASPEEITAWENVNPVVPDSTSAETISPVITRIEAPHRGQGDTAVPRIAQSNSNTMKPSSDVAPETRGLNMLSWIAIALLFAGIVVAILSFLPAAAASIGLFLGVAPFLIVAALVLGLIVMFSAKKRMQAGGSSDYDQLRKRGKVIALLASGVIFIFLLFLALVIAALSNFQ